MALRGVLTREFSTTSVQMSYHVMIIFPLKNHLFIYCKLQSGKLAQELRILQNSLHTLQLLKLQLKPFLIKLAQVVHKFLIFYQLQIKVQSGLKLPRLGLKQTQSELEPCLPVHHWWQSLMYPFIFFPSSNQINQQHFETF